MKVTSLHVERYKSFRVLNVLGIRPLTVIVGANNAGKSALARAVPLMAGAFLPPETAYSEALLPLRSFGLGHGDTFEDLVAGRAVHGSIELRLGFRGAEEGRERGKKGEAEGEQSLSVTVQNVVSPGQETRQVVSEWWLDEEAGRSVILNREMIETDTYRVTLTDREERLEMSSEQVEWRGLIPRSATLRSQEPWAGWLSEAMRGLTDWAQGIRYLRSPRTIIESPFRTPASLPSALGITGKEAPRMLAASDSLLKAVRGWYKETFGVRLDVRQQGDTSVVEVNDHAGGGPVAIAQAGQGLSHVLPVAIQCLTAQEAGDGLDIVEHPEAELHPRAHAAIADLMVETMTGPSRPMMVETHSEVFLLRLRRKVAEAKLAPENLAIYWIDRDEQVDSAVVREVKVTREGDVEGWPEGVFAEDYEEVMAIRRAARHRGDR